MMFRLTQEPGGLGCQLHGNGLRLAGVPLLFLGQNGFFPRPANEIQLLIGSAYGPKFDVPSLLRGLNTVARALNEKDMVRASIAAVHLRLPVLDWPGAIRIAKADDVLSKYDPDEPRDWHGRWTNGGGGATDSNVISPLAFIADDEGGVLDTAYQGVFHDWLVQDLANYFRAKGATVLTNVRLVAVDGTTAVADMLIWVPGKPPVIVEVKTGIDLLHQTKGASTRWPKSVDTSLHQMRESPQWELCLAPHCHRLRSSLRINKAQAPRSTSRPHLIQRSQNSSSASARCRLQRRES